MHPLRVAAERHKARLHAEFTKVRIRKGYSSLDGLRTHVNRTAEEREDYSQNILDDVRQKPHPRWVRINALKTSIKTQLATTFADYKCVDSLDEVLNSLSRLSTDQVLHIDKHIPDLIALAPFANISTLSAYCDGLIIVQDKASCFPAYLLDPVTEDGDCLDACAAPGNKTTHLAAIMHHSGSDREKTRIWACERDSARATVLQKMVTIAGANNHVTIQVGQDFLRINPAIDPWRNVGALLLDPSCSGSGIIGRDELLPFDLPSAESSTTQPVHSKKRKRKYPVFSKETTSDEAGNAATLNPKPEDKNEQSQARLVALSKFQTKLLIHAMTFPKARKITYSTCSIHAVENEVVVSNALQSEVARNAGWRLLVREEQVAGMRNWSVRGEADFFRDSISKDEIMAKELAEACIRCNMGTSEGTQGFFVAAFIRNYATTQSPHEDEWEGFD